MTRFLHWLVDYWYIPLVVLGGIFLFVMSRGKESPSKILFTELDAIKAGSDAKKVQAEKGAEIASEEVRKKHAEALKKLDEEQKAEAERLKNDPVALSKFLIRASK